MVLWNLACFSFSAQRAKLAQSGPRPFWQLISAPEMYSKSSKDRPSMKQVQPESGCHASFDLALLDLNLPHLSSGRSARSSAKSSASSPQSSLEQTAQVLEVVQSSPTLSALGRSPRGRWLPTPNDSAAEACPATKPTGCDSSVAQLSHVHCLPAAAALATAALQTSS